VAAGRGLRQLEGGAQLGDRQFLALEQQQEAVACRIRQGLQPGDDRCAQKTPSVRALKGALG
jgi:hypothetical protein